MSDITFSSSARSPQLIYTLDAVAGFVPGLALLFLHAPIAELIGAPQFVGFIAAIGAFLVPWGLFNYAIGTAKGPAWSSVLANIIGDGLWMAFSAALITLQVGQFNLLGQVLLVSQALFVVLVFLAKLHGARNFRGA